jgi:hypothetical protein
MSSQLVLVISGCVYDVVGTAVGTAAIIAADKMAVTFCMLVDKRWR